MAVGRVRSVTVMRASAMRANPRPRNAGKRTAYARLPGGMGSGHNGGKPCTNHAHDPTEGGNVRARFPMCTGTLLSSPVRPRSRSQLRW